MPNGQRKSPIIQPLRWHPYSRDAHAFVLGLSETTVRFLVTPLGHNSQVRMQSLPLFQACIRTAILMHLRDNNNRIRFWRESGVVGMVEQLEAEQRRLRELLEGKPVALDLFEAHVRLNALIQPNHPWSGGNDFWGYVDALTGGNCNGLIRKADGGEVYEANVYGLQGFRTLTAARHLELMALTADIPSECRELLPDELKEGLAALPRMETIIDAIRAEHLLLESSAPGPC